MWRTGWLLWTLQQGNGYGCVLMLSKLKSKQDAVLARQMCGVESVTKDQCKGRFPRVRAHVASVYFLYCCRAGQLSRCFGISVCSLSCEHYTASPHMAPVAPRDLYQTLCMSF